MIAVFGGVDIGLVLEADRIPSAVAKIPQPR